MGLIYVGGNTAEGTNSNITVSLTALSGGASSTAATNDVVIVAWGCVSTAAQTLTVISPTGYTYLFNALYADDNRDSNLRAAWKKMGATADTSVVLSNSGVSTNACWAAVHVWRNVHGTTPIDTTTQTATGTNTGQPDPPSITPATVGATVIAVYLGTSTTARAGEVATGFTNFVTASTADPGNSGGLALCSQSDWVSGAVDPGTTAGWSTAGTDSWAAATIALRPNGGGVFTTTTYYKKP